MKQDASGVDKGSSPAPTRKDYQKPQLQVYGELGALTRAVLGAMANDGSGHPNKHFTS